MLIFFFGAGENIVVCGELADSNSRLITAILVHWAHFFPGLAAGSESGGIEEISIDAGKLDATIPPTNKLDASLGRNKSQNGE